MATRKVLMGNHAVSWGVMRSRVQVIAAYPITPQTQVVEELSEICAKGLLKARFIKVESEHSAAACIIGASLAGARAFTATSAQGLALMHELLHWAGLARTPIVIADVNRAMAPGWSIWTDQTDSLSQRDTGMMQWYCETNQEVLDSVILGYKVAERVYLPLMIVYDAFLLSHTYEVVEIPDQEEIDRFLPPFKPRYRTDINNPCSFGALTPPDYYMELRFLQQEAMEEAIRVTQEEAELYANIFNRYYDLIEKYRCDDAELIIVCAGSMTATAREAVDRMRDVGIPVGLLKIRVFRPFPRDQVKDILRKANKVVVLDRNISIGCEGIFASEIKNALYGVANPPQVHPFIVGLGGRDVPLEIIKEAVAITIKRSKSQGRPEWLGLNR